MVDDIFAVFTGMELVLPGNDNDEGKADSNSKGDYKGNANGNGNGIAGVRMIKHKSRSCRSHGTNLIKSVL